MARVLDLGNPTFSSQHLPAIFAFSTVHNLKVKTKSIVKSIVDFCE